MRGNGKRTDGKLRAPELVIPAEGNLVRICAQRRHAFFDVDHACRRDGAIFVGRRKLAFTLVRQLMNDVHQRLLMHRLVLHDRMSRLGPHQTRNVRVVDAPRGQRALDGVVATRRKLCDGTAIRPVFALEAPRLREATRVDATLEEPLERRVDRRLAQSPLVERQKTERRNVTFVENKGMAQGDGPLVKSGVVDQGEERRGALAIEAVRVEEFRAVERAGNYSVPRFSCSRSIETKSALKLPFPNERLPLRWMISKKTVGRSCSGLVKI